MAPSCNKSGNVNKQLNEWKFTTITFFLILKSLLVKIILNHFSCNDILKLDRSNETWNKVFRKWVFQFLFIVRKQKISIFPSRISIKYQLIMNSINKALLPLRDNLLKIILLDIFYLQKIYAPFSSSHYWSDMVNWI